MTICQRPDRSIRRPPGAPGVRLLYVALYLLLCACNARAAQPHMAPQPAATTQPLLTATAAAGSETPAAAAAERGSACAARQDGGEGTQDASGTPALRPSDPEVKVRYDEDTKTIVIRKGSAITLAELSRALARPTALRELTPGEWLLGANLQIEEGAALRIAAPEVRWLKLRSDAEGFVWIKALGGALEFASVCVTSWDTAGGSVDENYADGRSFVLARDGARMDIRDSELSYLGYGADESYGVAWRLKGTGGAIVNSSLGYNFYGLYTYQVSELVIRGNEVHHSIRYGIDPHTGSNRLTIEENIAHHNGKHGIILAEECTESVIRNNQVYSNTMHGIVLYQDSDNNLVEGNTSYDNGLEGINVNDASDNIIRSNTVYGNAEAGIGIGQAARNNRVTGNEVRENREDGIALYSSATKNTLDGNVVRQNGRYGIYMKSKGNRIAAGNQVFGNRIGVYLNVKPPPEVSRQTNWIYDNDEADVRTSDQ